MKKIISHYNRIMTWAKNHRILKYFVDRNQLTQRWYKTRVYKFFAAPAIIIKRKHIYSRTPFAEAGTGIMLALFGLIPPLFWRDWFVFALFFPLSVIFILKTTNVRAAANYSIFLYIFVLTAILSPPTSEATFLFLLLLAIFGISFLIMNVTDEPEDISKILYGVYVAVLVRAIYVSFDTLFAGAMHAGDNFSEFLIMMFPFALAFVFLKCNKRWRWLLLVGLLPTLYGVFAVIFDIGNILHAQILDIPNILETYTNGNLIDVAMTAQGIFARAGTVGTRPFLDIYNAAMEVHDSEFLTIRLALYVGMFGILLFLWHILRLIRKAIVGMFKQKGDARIVLIAGIMALLGTLVIIPFEFERIGVRTLFLYWIIIGIVGGIVKNDIGIEEKR